MKVFYQISLETTPSLVSQSNRQTNTEGCDSDTAVNIEHV